MLIKFKKTRVVIISMILDKHIYMFIYTLTQIYMCVYRTNAINISTFFLYTQPLF